MFTIGLIIVNNSERSDKWRFTPARIPLILHQTVSRVL
jgi:hypothetical protein